MAPRSQKKIAKKVDADDNSSASSLSFASFLSIQDLQPIPPATNGTSHIKKQDQEFEFNRGTPVSATCNENMNHPVHPTAQQQSDNTTSGASDKPHRDGNHGQRKGATSNSWYGKRIYRSMISPCRECKAHEPAIRKRNMPGVASKPR